MTNAFDRIIPVLCIAVIIWPFAIVPFAFASALLASIFGIALFPAFVAYGAMPLAIYWASKLWAAL
jgi:hypothetical protein